MKINPLGSSGVNPYNRQVHKAAQTSNIQRSDKVEISKTAKEMQQLSQIPAERQARINELKSQVENGTYKLDARETAKSITDYYSK